MEIEYKDCGIKLWTNEADRVKNIQEFERRQAAQELERKAILAEPDPIRRRLATLRQKLRAAGMEV